MRRKEFNKRNKVKVKEKFLGESERFLKFSDIVERIGLLICFGIVEGENPCFVYRGNKSIQVLVSRATFFISFY